MSRSIVVTAVALGLATAAPIGAAEHLAHAALIDARLEANAVERTKGAAAAEPRPPGGTHLAAGLGLDVDTPHAGDALLVASDGQDLERRAARLHADPDAQGLKASTVALIVVGGVVLWLGLGLIGYAIVGGS